MVVKRIERRMGRGLANFQFFEVVLPAVVACIGHKYLFVALAHILDSQLRLYYRIVDTAGLEDKRTLIVVSHKARAGSFLCRSSLLNQVLED